MMTRDSITDDTPIPILLKLLSGPFDPEESWPENFHGWENVKAAYRIAMQEAIPLLRPSPVRKEGRGIAICGGGKYLCSAYITLKAIRHIGNTDPVEIFHLGEEEMDRFHRQLFRDLGATCFDLTSTEEWQSLRMKETKERGWLSKPLALRYSSFSRVLALDADSYPVRPTDYLFSHPKFVNTGALFWPDIHHHDFPDWKWLNFGLAPQRCWSFESGQMVIDTKTCWKEIALTIWLNDHHDYYYRWFWGDKETFCIAWRALGRPYGMPIQRWVKIAEQALVQYGLEEKDPAPQFVHRCRCKYVPVAGDARYGLFWNTPQTDYGFIPFIPELPLEWETRRWFRHYLEMHRCLPSSSPASTGSDSTIPIASAPSGG